MEIVRSPETVLLSQPESQAPLDSRHTMGPSPEKSLLQLNSQLATELTTKAHGLLSCVLLILSALVRVPRTSQFSEFAPVLSEMLPFLDPRRHSSEYLAAPQTPRIFRRTPRI
jgi:hypothetical protein